MKKIINGKRYDSKTAKEIGDNWNGVGAGDLNYFCETLYRKTTGEFFLLGEGGANTIYAEECGNNSWTGGREIIPLTFKAAQEWAEENLPGEKYEAIFGEVVEDEIRKMVTVSLPVAAIEKLNQMAAKTGRKKMDIVADLILEAKIPPSTEEMIDATYEHLLYTVAGSADPERVETLLSSYANDYVLDKYPDLPAEKQNEIIDAAVALYENQD